MGRTLEQVTLWLHRLGAVIAVLSCLLICYDVGARLLLNRPFPGTAELVATGLAIMLFLQAPYSILHKKLLRVTFVFDASGAIGRSVLNVIAYLAGAVFFLALAVTSWEPMVDSVRRLEFYGMDAFRIPAWPLRVSTFVLWLVAALVCLYFVVEAARGRLSDWEEQIPD